MAVAAGGGYRCAGAVILPALTLALGYLGTYVRLLRANMLAHLHLHQPYVDYARARGLSSRRILWRHVLVNTLYSPLVALGMSIPKLFAGTLIIENIFSWPGLGRLCVSAIFQRDYPMMQAYVLLMALLFVVGNFLIDILPLSHDEVVHGKRSLLDRMPGDVWQKFANLRAYYGFMWAFPGKKLLFMGGEFAQGREWNHDTSLDWHLLDEPEGWLRGIQQLVKDLNHCYRAQPPLYQLDFQSEGFEWRVVDDRENSVFTFVRRDRQGNEVLVVSNFTPVPREGYRIGINQPAGALARNPQ